MGNPDYLLCPQLDAIVWTDVCKIKVWAKRVRLPSTSELEEAKEELGEGEEEKMRGWRRRRRTFPPWKDPNPGVQLCPFDMCPAMEHSAHKVCWLRVSSCFTAELAAAGLKCAELTAGVQMAFLSLFESSTEPANPCNFKRTAVWLEQSRKMTQIAYNKAQDKRVAALKKIRGTCITPGKTKRSGGNALQGDLDEGEEEKVGSGRRLLGRKNPKKKSPGAKRPDNSGGSNGCTVSITGDKLKHSVKGRHCKRGFCDAESGSSTETVLDGKCYDVTWQKMLMKLKELRKSRQGVQIRKLCRAWKSSKKITKYHIDALKSRKVLASVKEQIRNLGVHRRLSTTLQDRHEMLPIQCKYQGSTQVPRIVYIFSSSICGPGHRVHHAEMPKRVSGRVRSTVECKTKQNR